MGLAAEVPLGVHKAGAGLDLPIASVLVATGELSPSCTEGLAFCGELGLNGSLRHVPGINALADAAAPLHLVVPLCTCAARTGAGRRGPRRRHAGRAGRDPAWPASLARGTRPSRPLGATVAPDLSDVRVRRSAGGRSSGAAAGRHHVLMIGPPGSGKAMLAERLVGLLPPPTPTEALPVTRIHSTAGCVAEEDSISPPPPTQIRRSVSVTRSICHLAAGADVDAYATDSPVVHRFRVSLWQWFQPG